MSVTSCVRLHGGVPTLFVDGAPVEGLAYVTYLRERADYAAFAALGCRLFSVTTFFASRPVNATEKLAPFEKGVFEDPAAPDFSAVDEALAEVVAACPDALIFPRVNTNPPLWWERQHPQECNDAGLEGHPPHVCPASAEYRVQVCSWLRQYLDHVETGPFADHVIGYMVAGGQTEEWMAVDMNGNTGAAMRRSFAAAYPEGADEAARRRHASDVTADAVCTFARCVKQATGGKKVVGAFYGYTFETPWWQAANSAVAPLLREPSVDFLSSPLSYHRMRAPGIDWACMSVQDSIRLHGKLYFGEADIRTCQSRPLNAARPGAAVDGWYGGGIWDGPADPWLCAQLLRAALARALCRGTALWWFDMWGGWYDHPALRREMTPYFDLMRKSSAQPVRGATAQLAVFADERATAQMDGPGDPRMTVMSENLIPLGACGAPYDVYDVTDFDAVSASGQYRAAVFLVPVMTAALADAMAHWRQKGLPLLLADEAHPVRTAEEYAALCGKAGIFRWLTPQDAASAGTPFGDVVYAGGGFAALHAASAGKKVLHLPAACRVSAALAEADTAAALPSLPTDTVTLRLRQYETVLLRLDAAQDG